MALTEDDVRGSPSADVGDALALAAFRLAQRFSAGATLWCVAPYWREHARHVAVEFVHPVIVGKPALPAVSVDAADVVVALRTLARPGDVVLVIGGATDPNILDLVRRAPAWGATSMWIGVGPRPDRRNADHVLWVDDDGSAAYDGRLVLHYHLLWELTHVCLEHRGLMRIGLMRTEGAACGEASTEVCITCSDEGRLGEVVAVEYPLAQVRTASGTEVIDTTLVAPVAMFDLLLIHAGTAIAIVDDLEAGG